MTDLVTHAQLQLLARTLHVPAQRLAHLERLGSAALHELQERMATVIFDQHTDTFQRISKLVPLIPVSVMMPQVQRMAPPAIAGRVSGAIGVAHPKKAAEAVALLSIGYAADCAPYLDPRTVGSLAENAAGAMIRILNEILRRRDYITVGPLLARATPALIAAVEQGVHDDDGLVYSAAYAFSTTSVNAAMRQFLTGPRRRMPRLIRAVLGGPPTLQHAALTIFARCEPDLVREVGDIVAAVGSPDAIGNLIVVAIRSGAVPELLTFAGRLSEPSAEALAGTAALTEPAVLSSVVRTLDEYQDAASWQGLFMLAARMDDEHRRQVVRLLAGLSEPTVAALPAHATETNQWPALLRMLASADTEVAGRIGAVWAALPPERRAGLHRHLDERRDDPQLTLIRDAIGTVPLEQIYYRRRQQWRHRGSADFPEFEAPERY